MITITCNFCGAKSSSINVSEIMEWDTAHDAFCPGKSKDGAE
jgi:hypothetical protein